jgi:hypothetical protein
MPKLSVYLSSSRLIRHENAALYLSAYLAKR